MIPTQQHLQGNAEIFTEERRLLEHLLDKIKAPTEIDSSQTMNFVLKKMTLTGHFLS